MRWRALVAWFVVALGETACAPHEPGAGPCARGLMLAGGACLGPAEADAFCGARALAVGGVAACAVPACARGEALDPVALACADERSVRGAASLSRTLADDEVLTCRGDLVLVLHAGHLGCVSRDDVCPGAARWDGLRCLPRPPCAPGEVETAAGGGLGRCVPLRRGSAIDVGAWAHEVLPDRLCRTVRRQAVEGSAPVEASIDVVFPGNDVTAASVTARFDPPGPPESTRAELQASMDALLVPLRAMGGTADAASVGLRISCPVPANPPPRTSAR